MYMTQRVQAIRELFAANDEPKAKTLTCSNPRVLSSCRRLGSATDVFPASNYKHVLIPADHPLHTFMLTYGKYYVFDLVPESALDPTSLPAIPEDPLWRWAICPITRRFGLVHMNNFIHLDNYHEVDRKNFPFLDPFYYNFDDVAGSFKVKSGPVEYRSDRNKSMELGLDEEVSKYMLQSAENFVMEDREPISSKNLINLAAPFDWDLRLPKASQDRDGLYKKSRGQYKRLTFIRRRKSSVSSLRNSTVTIDSNSSAGDSQNNAGGDLEACKNRLLWRAAAYLHHRRCVFKSTKLDSSSHVVIKYIIPLLSRGHEGDSRRLTYTEYLYYPTPVVAILKRHSKRNYSREMYQNKKNNYTLDLKKGSVVQLLSQPLMVSTNEVMNRVKVLADVALNTRHVVKYGPFQVNVVEKYLLVDRLLPIGFVKSKVLEIEGHHPGEMTLQPPLLADLKVDFRHFRPRRKPKDLTSLQGLAPGSSRKASLTSCATTLLSNDYYVSRRHLCPPLFFFLKRCCRAS